MRYELNYDGCKLKESIEKIASNLEEKIDLLRSELRSEMAEMEERLNIHIDGVGACLTTTPPSENP